jgi:hypothetical protein
VNQPDLFDRLLSVSCDHGTGTGTLSVHTPGFFENGGRGTACAACPRCVRRVLAVFTEAGATADLKPIGARP